MVGSENVRTFAPGNSLNLDAIGLDGLVVGSADGCDGAIARLLHAPGVVGADGTGADYYVTDDGINVNRMARRRTSSQ